MSPSRTNLVTQPGSVLSSLHYLFPLHDLPLNGMLKADYDSIFMYQNPLIPST